MIDKVKIVPKVIRIHEGRASFLKAEKAQYRTNAAGQEIKIRPDGKAVLPRYSMTWLLDPSNAQAAATIKEIKDEAARQLDLFHGGRENWPKDNQQTGTKGILMCFGKGNDLPKVYSGYKDMFFIKVSDTARPIIGDRRGRAVQFVQEDGQWHYVSKQTGITEEIADPAGVPYGGAYCTGRISLYLYNYGSHGVNANFNSCQFVRPGESFGGRAAHNAEDELMAMAGDAEPATAAASDDPWG